MSQSQWLAKLQRHFPSTDFSQGVTPSESWDFFVILTDQFVYRVAKHQQAARNLQREHRLLEYLSDQVSIAIPRYTFCQSDPSIVVYPIVPGRELNQKMFASLSLNERERIHKKLAEFIVILHSVNPITYLDLGYQPVDKVEDRKYCQTLIKTIYPYIEPNLTRPELIEVERYLIELFEQYSVEPVLCHNDLYSRNIIYSKADGEIGVIDFSDCGLYHSAFELSCLNSWLLEGVLRNYTLPLDNDIKEKIRFFSRRFPIYHLYGAIKGAPVDLQSTVDSFKKRFFSLS